MPRTLNRLTARRVESARDPGLICDGGGLYLKVAPGGSKQWTFRFTLHGRKREAGLGPIHTLTLSEAREMARERRKLLLEGIDPIEHRRQTRTAARLEQMRMMTFEQCAAAYIAAHESKWTNARHAGQWRATLEQHAFPLLGKLPVSDIDTALVVKVLEPIWKTIPETASRLRGRIEKVLGWATVSGFRVGDNPARWRGHIAELFPVRTGSVHHVALPYLELPAFMTKLRADSSVQSAALQFTILTAARRDEARLAQWGEIDFATCTWTVPATRMKNRKPHRVPLCDAAMAVLEAMQALRRSEFVFPGVRGDKAIDPETMMRLLKALAGPDVTLHGFRSSFRTWAAEKTNFPREIAELALAHTVSSEVERAYQRSDMVEKRRAFMAAWAGFLARPTPEGSVVMPLRRA